MNYAVGNNDPGYLPEGDVWVTDRFELAKAALAYDLETAADHAESWVEPHDCDDIPCPTYGDTCPWNLAQDLRAAAQEVNGWTVPGSILVDRVYWIEETDEPTDK